MSTISVIIPTWNREATLKRAILSVLGQTYPVTEILVCDDGSTDNSREVVEAIGSDKVKWLEAAHVGMPSIPRNRGIAMSKGEWLAFLDSDDEWLPEKIQQQITAAEKFKTDAVCSNAFRIVPGSETGKPYLSIENKKLAFEQLIKCNYVICSSVMVKRELFGIVKGFPESTDLKAIEDYALWLRVATQTGFAYLEEPKVNYFDDPAQSIRNNKITEAEQRRIIFGDLLKWLHSIDEGKGKRYKSLVKKEIKKAEGTNHKGIFSLFR